MVGNFRVSAKQTQVRPITTVKPVVSNRPVPVSFVRPVQNLSRPVVTQIRPISNPNIPTFPGIQAIDDSGLNFLQQIERGYNRQKEYNEDHNLTGGLYNIVESLQTGEFWLDVGAMIIAILIIVVSVYGMVK